MSWVPERLHRLLGSDLASITPDDLDRLIREEVVEGPDLEFKREPWDTDHTQKKKRPDANIELARDLAQFANASGGLIIVGAAECDDGSGMLMEFRPLPWNHKLVEHITQVASERIKPRLIVEIHTVRFGSGNIILIAIPPSDGRPHAVQEKSTPSYSFPVRSTISRQFLHENELAEQYQARLQRHAEPIDRLNILLDRGRLVACATIGPFRLRDYRGVKLVMGCVPTTSHHLELDADLLAEYSAWVRGTEVWIPPLRREIEWGFAFPDTGAIRFGSRADSEQPLWTSRRDTHAAALNVDGSGWFAFDITSFVSPSRRSDEDRSYDYAGAYTLDLVRLLIVGVRILAEHAVRAKSSDLLHFGVQVMASGGEDVRISIGLRPTRWWSSGDRKYQRESAPLYHVFSAASLCSSLQDVLAAVYRIGTDLVRGFHIIEVPEITRAGELIIPAIPRREQPLFSQWAGRHGIPCIRGQ